MRRRGLHGILIIALFAAASVSGVSAEDEVFIQATRVFRPLPMVMASEKNPVTPEKVALGKMLFYENRISIDGTVSCAKCHPVSLYVADGLRKWLFPTFPSLKLRSEPLCNS